MAEQFGAKDPTYRAAACCQHCKWCHTRWNWEDTLWYCLRTIELTVVNPCQEREIEPTSVCDSFEFAGE